VTDFTVKHIYVCTVAMWKGHCSTYCAQGNYRFSVIYGEGARCSCCRTASASSNSVLVAVSPWSILRMQGLL